MKKKITFNQLDLFPSKIDCLDNKLNYAEFISFCKIFFANNKCQDNSEINRIIIVNKIKKIFNEMFNEENENIDGDNINSIMG